MTTEDANYVISIASIADAELLAHLGEQTFREAFGRFIPPADLDSYLGATYSPAKQVDELSNPAKTLLVIESEGLAVGYAMLHAHEVSPVAASENTIELARLYLLQGSIGRGIGSALMGECIEESRRRAHQAIWLQVWERNERAIAFYKRWGFEAVGVGSKELGDSTGTDLIMVKMM
jgi:ribosomal protein S18 acetylase RimI-like enzyme